MTTNSTDYAILGMLSIGPMSGYFIRKSIQDTVAHFWSESYGQLYPALKRLSAQGLVRARTAKTGQKVRHVYTLTASGRSRLKDWLAAPPETRPPRIELLLKLFFGRLAAEACASHVRDFREQQARLLKTCEAMEGPFAAALKHPSDPGLAFRFTTLRYGILHLHADLAWADETLAFLAKHPRP
jgi:DNA-binding PadR family transcriptional regulator